MILAESAPRSSGRVRRLLNWDAMPLAVRVLVVVLLVATFELTIRIATPLLNGTALWHDAAYNAVSSGRRRSARSRRPSTGPSASPGL